MTSYFKYFLNLNESSSLGNKLFLIGIFFLPSAIPIGGLFLLTALIISAFKNHKEFRNYAFKGKFGLISFFIYMFLVSLTVEFGLGPAPVIIACILIFPFFFLTFMPLLKNLRDEEYPEINWKSYLPLLVPLLFFIMLFIALVFEL